MSDQYTPTRAASATDIVEAIERAIGEGRLSAGDRLAPIRTAAGTLDLAPNTVASAYRSLVRRGFAVGRGRAGTFIAPRPGVAPPHEPVPADLVDLASGNPDPALLPDLGPHLAALDPRPTLYGEPAIDPSLEAPARRVLAAALGEEVAGRIAIVNGALDGVERVLMAHLRPGDAVALEAPGWPAISDLVATMGLRPVPVPVDQRGIVPDRLARIVDDVEALVVTPRMQNPTGATLDAERAGDLGEVLAARPRLLVIEDDHGGLIADAPLYRITEDRARWAYVQSVSKPLGPDLRLAFLTGDDLTVNRVVARQSAGPGWVSHLIQRLVTSVLEAPATTELLDSARRAYTLRRGWMVEALLEQGIDPMRGRTGLSVWAPVPDEQTAVAAAAEAGYAIRPGGRWRMESASPAVRIAIGLLSEPMAGDVAAAIADGLRRRPTRIA